MPEELDVGTLRAEITLDGSEDMIEKLNDLNKALIENQYQQKNCNKTIAEAAKELEKIQKQIGENGEADEEQAEKIEQLNVTIEQEKTKLAQLKTEQTNIKQAVSQTTKAIADESKSVKEAADSSEELSENNEKMNNSFTVSKAVIADLVANGLQMLIAKLLEIGKSVIETGESFTASMSEVGAISGATGEELEKLTQTAREFGSKTKFSASEAADALKYMSLAGWDAEQSMSALGGILDLAAASGMELAQASDMVTDYLSAFGMSAEQASYMADLMTYAQSNSNTSAQQLGEAWRNCAANMNAAGQDIETVTSLLEAMANQGKKGSEAGTALSAIMRDITSKMENGRVTIGETSIAVQDAKGNFRDLTDILSDVEKATDGMGTAQRAAALQSVFTDESIKGVNLVLQEGIDNISEYEEALRSSTGAAAEAAKTMSDNLGGDLKTMESAFEELKLKIYDDAEAPIRSIVQTITKDGVPALEALAGNIDKIVPIVIAAASAFGTYKTAVAMQSLISGVVQAVNSLKAAKIGETVATKAASAAQKELNVVQAANPVGALVSVIALLVTGLTSYAAIASTAANSTEQLNVSTNNYLETIERTEQQSKENAEQTEADISTIQELKSQYDELRNRTDLTAESKKNLKSVSEELAKKLGISTEELQEQDGTYKDLTKDIDEYIKKLQEKIRFETNEENYTAAYKAYNQAVSELSEVNKQIDELHQKMSETGADKEIEKLTEQYHNGEISYDSYTKKCEECIEKIGASSQSLENLKKKQTEYMFQVTQSAEAVAKAEKAINSELDTDKRLDELLGVLTGKTVGNTEALNENMVTAKELEKAKASMGGTVSKLSEDEEALSEKLTEQNKALEDNKSKLRAAKKERDEYAKRISNVKEGEMSLKDFEELLQSYETAKNKVAELETKQKLLKTEISKTKGEIDKAARANRTLAERLEELNQKSSSLKSAMSELAGVYQKLNDGQALDFETVLGLCEKYPEYANKLLEAGNNAELQKQAVMKLYEAKKQDYILTQEKAVLEMRVSNTATSVVIANIQMQIEYYKKLGDTISLIASIALTAQQIALRQQIEANEAEILRLENIINRMNSIDINGYRFDSGSGGSSNNSISNSSKDSYITWGLGYEATGDSMVSSQLSWLDRVTNLGKLNVREQKAQLEYWLRTEQMNADERYQVEYRLKQLTDKLADEEAAARKVRADEYLKQIDDLKQLDKIGLEQEINSYQYALKAFELTADQRQNIAVRLYNAQKQLKEKQEQAQEQALQNEYDRIDRLVERNQLSTRQEIAELEKIYQKYKLTTEQKIALDDKLYQKKQQLRDEEIAALDKLGDAVVAALKNKYEQQRQLEEQRIDESVENWKKWEDETVNAIQGQIDALDELRNAHDEENKREEYEQKRQALELKARYEKDDYNRKQIEKEIARLDLAENERLYNLQIEEQKKALQEQQEAAKKLSAQQQELLTAQKDETLRQYEELMSDFALQAAARKTILNSEQKEIINLINTYASDYEMLGTTIGESMYNAFAKQVDDIVAYVDTVAKKTDTIIERNDASRALNRYVNQSEQRQEAVEQNSVDKAEGINKIQEAVSSFAKMIDQISASAADYKNQMAVVASAAADKYYSTQQKYYSESSQNTVNQPATNLYMTVNFNDKVDSPIQVKRQLEAAANEIAKQIL